MKRKKQSQIHHRKFNEACSNSNAWASVAQQLTCAAHINPHKKQHEVMQSTHLTVHTSSSKHHRGGEKAAPGTTQAVHAPIQQSTHHAVHTLGGACPRHTVSSTHIPQSTNHPVRTSGMFVPSTFSSSLDRLSADHPRQYTHHAVHTSCSAHLRNVCPRHVQFVP